MKWGYAAKRHDILQRRLAALEEALARLDTEVNAVEEHQAAFVGLMGRQADEAVDRLAVLAQRIEALERRCNDAERKGHPINEEQLVKALTPLKLEIAAMAHQAVVDERQMQRAYLELTVQIERMKQNDATGPLPTRSSTVDR